LFAGFLYLWDSKNVIIRNKNQIGVNEMFDGNNFPPNPPPDPHAAKSNFDVNEKKLHTQGTPGLLSQVIDLFILVGIVAVVIILFKVL
jgi:hypothetical protein